MASTVPGCSGALPVGIRPDGWFNELSPQMWPGLAQSLKVGSVLHSERSEYQDLCVFDSQSAFGRVLTLDGVIQFTDLDELAYHEMMAHIPAFSHPNPQTVLIVGGGDGGVTRELLKHSSITSITICDIDRKVTEVSEKFFPKIACGVRDPRVTLVFEDGAKFVAEHPGQFDIIITDSSDPVGPAEVLYEKEYYTNLKRALKPGGIVCSQAESMWLHTKLIKALYDMCKHPDVGFDHVWYATISIPTYPSGTIGFLLCSTGPLCDKPVREPTLQEQAQLNYYNPALHKASFCLPTFVARQLS
ncbi:putrescine aminopropyltransferase [Pelomyxa schiedti]|nr:putrescine aminopropyltransferase [Pelomyxa schiedti]